MTHDEGTKTITLAQRCAMADLSKMSFEDALKELEEIVRKIETGEINLDEAIKAYERGSALKKHCDSKLKEAQEKVSKIKLDSDGSPTLENMNTGKDSAS